MHTKPTHRLCAITDPDSCVLVTFERDGVDRLLWLICTENGERVGFYDKRSQMMTFEPPFQNFTLTKLTEDA